MFPEEFRKRIKIQKYIDYKSLVGGLEEPSPVSIRINNSKWNRRPVNSEETEWCGTGYYLEKRPSFTLDPLFHAGCYYPQEASSFFIEEVLRQVVTGMNGLRVLDLCGAPGGKSTHLSSLIGDRGFLVANEVIRSRSLILYENLTKWGLSNSIVTQSDPAAFSSLPGYFDILLADAPCSGEGMFRDPVAVSEWSVENTMLCSERQKRILAGAWPALKEDGILIYSTCTFNPDENEKNIRWLLRDHKAESVELDVSGFNGITGIDYEGIYGYGFYPGKIRGDGLFISVLRKKEKTVAGNQKIRTGKYQLPDKNDITTAGKWSRFDKGSFISLNDEVFALPASFDEYLLLSKHLKIISCGTKIFSKKSDDYIPAHELALSVMSENNTFNKYECDINEALRFLRRGNLKTEGSPMGWLLVQYKGINLGFVKNIGSRVNNYYPVEWRIRMTSSLNEEAQVIKWE